MDKSVAFIAILFAFVSLYLWHLSQVPGVKDDIQDGVDAPDILKEHTKEFEPKIIKVTEGVHVAVGFAIANSILLEGPEGLVIVDTTESKDAARDILQHFCNISSKPIKAIVYTHNHADHCRGAEGFVEDMDECPPIIAHELLPDQLVRQAVIGNKLYRGALYQFGVPLHDEAFINAGLGPRIRISEGSSSHTLIPTILVKGERQEMDIAGLHLEFIHIPGETPDQMAVWLPEQKVLLPGDNIYKAFPNLYAIRGTPPRDVMVWARSLHKMAALNSEFLVPSHTKPVSGKDTIFDLLTTYAHAIEYIHDQTVRCINRNIHPDEAVKLVKLPKELAMHPYLQEFYGTVEWSVKSVYSQYNGWFSGDPVELYPLPPVEKAKRMIQLVGTRELLDAAEAAIYTGDLQWGLELASYVFKVRPSNDHAKSLRLQALRKLAARETSANGRHYYLVAALDDHDRVEWTVDITNHVMKSPISRILTTMKTRLKAEDVEGQKMMVALNFTDTQELFILKLDKSVLRVVPEEDIPVESDVIITTTTVTWKELILGKVSALSVYMSGNLAIDGSLWQMRKFMTFFDRRGRKR